MVYLYCEGCDNIIYEDINTSHKIVSLHNAPTGQRLKEYCPVWLMKQGDKNGI